VHGRYARVLPRSETMAAVNRVWKEYKELSREAAKNGPDKEILLAPIDDSSIFEWTVRPNTLLFWSAAQAYLTVMCSLSGHHIWPPRLAVREWQVHWPAPI
jgi:hypothetical protein